MADIPSSSDRSHPSVLRDLIFRDASASSLAKAKIGPTSRIDDSSRAPDAVDILCVVARRSWLSRDALVPDPETFQVLLSGTTNANSIREPTRSIDGKRIVLKTSHPVQLDDGLHYNMSGVLREVSVMERFKDEDAIATYDRVVWQLFGPVANPHTIVPSLESEMAPFGDLMQFANTNSAASVEVLLRLSQDVVEGLRALHYWGVAHGDLKPQNVLVYNDRFRPFVAKLIDFGASDLEVNAVHSYSGTRGWRPTNWESISSFDDCRQADIFSLGMTIFGAICRCSSILDLASGTQTATRALPLTPSDPVSLLQAIQRSDHFSEWVMTMLDSRRQMKAFERKTLENIFRIAFAANGKRSLDECYKLLLRHPYKTSDCRRSVSNPKGKSGFVFGIGPRLDGLPNAFDAPTNAEKVQPLSSLRIDIDYQFLENQNASFKSFVFDILNSVVNDESQPASRCADAHFSMAQCFSNGFGVAINRDMVIQHLFDAARLGHVAASAVYWQFLDDTGGAEADFTMSCLFKTAASSPIAARELLRRDQDKYHEMLDLRVLDDLENIHGINASDLEKMFWTDAQVLRTDALKRAFGEDGARPQPIGTAGDNLLHYLSIKGDAESLKQILEQFPPASLAKDQRDHFGWSPTLLACKYGRLQALRTLLDAGCSVTTTGLLAITCFQYLTNFDDESVDEAAELLFSHGCDPAARVPSLEKEAFAQYLPQISQSGHSPLLLAVKRENSQAMTALLKYITRESSRYLDMSSMLFPSTGSWTVEQLEGFSVPWPNDLIDAFRESLCGHRIAMAQICMQFGNKHKDLEEQIQECLMYAFRCYSLFDRRAIHGVDTHDAMVSTIHFIIERGYKLRHRHEDGRSLLHDAILYNQNDVFEYLLTVEMKEYAPDLDCQWENVVGGMAPLQYALVLGRENMVIKLLEASADLTVNSPTSLSINPSIVWFWLQGRFQDNKLLDQIHTRLGHIERLRDEGDCSAFRIALSKGRYDTATAILNFSGGKELTQLSTAATPSTPLGHVVWDLSEHYATSLSYLLNPRHSYGGVGFIIQPEQRLSAYHVLLEGHKARFRAQKAFAKGNQDPTINAMRLLLTKFTEVDHINHQDIYGRTPLYLAVAACIEPIVRQLLIRYQADPTIAKHARSSRHRRRPIDKANKEIKRLKNQLSTWPTSLLKKSKPKFPPDFYEDMPAIQDLLLKHTKTLP